MASVLKSTVRRTDLVCRIGGEEFLVICPNVKSEGAAVCAENLRAAVEANIFQHAGEELSVTISCGVAEFTRGMSHADDLLMAADNAMYESKAAGRNRVSIAAQTAAVSS
jgi:diguanylate cyclase (GGDEF)-like protein